jgi:predicted TIM-barrel fold metal-dependent hydrolase
MALAAAAAAPTAQAQAPAPATSAAPAGEPKGREQRMLIVDAQIHIWKSSKPNPNHRQIADYSADDALKEMDEAGVTAAVIHPPGWDPNANALAVEAARQHPNRFAILGNFPLDRPESRSLIDGPARQVTRTSPILIATSTATFAGSTMRSGPSGCSGAPTSPACRPHGSSA